MEPTETTGNARLAFRFEFDRPLRPLSDAEGIINGFVDDAGVSGRGRLVEADRRTMYVAFDPAEPVEIGGEVYHTDVMESFERVVEKVAEYDWLRVKDVDVTVLPDERRAELYRSAALAAKHEGGVQSADRCVP